MAVDVVLKDRNGNELNVGGKLYRHNIKSEYHNSGYQLFLTFYKTNNAPITTLREILDLLGYGNNTLCYIYNAEDDYQYIGNLYSDMDEMGFIGMCINDSSATIYDVFWSQESDFDDITDTIIPM